MDSEDTNQPFDMGMSPEESACFRYFRRAANMHTNAAQNEHSEARADFLAMCLHACQSLVEAMEILADAHNNNQLANRIGSLPHVELIGELRNLDIHGHPIPVCRPDGYFEEMVTPPTREQVQFVTQNGVAIQMQGIVDPKIRRFPKKVKDANVMNLNKAIVLVGNRGRLFVKDTSGRKPVLRSVLHATGDFLVDAQKVLGEYQETQRVGQIV